MNSILVLHIDQKYQSDNLYSNYHPSEQIRKVYQNINKLVSKYHLHINSIYVLKALVNVISERKLNVTLKYSCQYIDDT